MTGRRTGRSRRGFFLRAEDFFGHLRRQAIDDARLLREQHERSTASSSDRTPEEAQAIAIGADLLDATPIAEIAFEELEHVRTMRELLNAPERYLRHLRAAT